MTEAAVGSQARAKVFGIGLMKTATFSLHEALRSLGYKSLHNGNLETMNSVQQAIDEGKPMFDLPRSQPRGLHRHLRRHLLLLSRRRPVPRLPVHPHGARSRGLARQPATSRREGPADERRRRLSRRLPDSRHRRVEDRVPPPRGGRARLLRQPTERLLVLDITAGQGWEPLCEFLDHPVPEAPFPWKNQFQPWAAQSGRSRPKSAR